MGAYEREKPHWNELLCKHIINEMSHALFRKAALFPPVDVLLELLVAIHITANAARKLGMQIEIRGVLALEGDEITCKTHIVTDKHAVADSQLQSKALVVRRPNPDCGSTFLSYSVVSVNHPEELGFLELRIAL